MNKPDVLMQWILLLLLSFTLSACLKNEDKDSHVQLPNINPNLSTESPEGVWLFHMNIDVTENSISSDKQREKSSHYFVRQLVTIKPTEQENVFWPKAGCGRYSSEFNINSLMAVDDDTELPANWKLDNQQFKPFDNSEMQNYPEMEALSIFDPYFSWSYIENGGLTVNQNLSLSGQLIIEANANYIANEDPLFFTSFYLNGYDQVKYSRSLNISAVKLSDSTAFDTAAEITYRLNIQSDLLDISHSEYMPYCLDSREKRSYIVTRRANSSEVEAKQTEAFTLGMESLLPETDSLVILKTYQDYENAPSVHLLGSDWDSYHIIQPCYDETSEQCSPPISFELEQRSKDINGFSVEAEIIEHDGTEVKIDTRFIFPN